MSTKKEKNGLKKGGYKRKEKDNGSVWEKGLKENEVLKEWSRNKEIYNTDQEIICK